MKDEGFVDSFLAYNLSFFICHWSFVIFQFRLCRRPVLSIAQIETMIFTRTWFLLILLPGIAAAQELKILPQPKEVKATREAFPADTKVRIFIRDPKNSESETIVWSLQEDVKLALDASWKVEDLKQWNSKSRSVVLGLLEGNADVTRILKARKVAVPKVEDPEGYFLHVSRDQVTVLGKTNPGLFYGVQTLRQMIMPQSGGHAIPGVEIRDWPSMRYRGLHDDISRGPIPKTEFIRSQIRRAAEYKMNIWSLYIEHVFDYQNHPLIGPKGGALTREEVQELVTYARKFYVDLIPEQQAFGHLHHVLKYEKYNELAETPHGHVLTPTNEKSYDLVRQLYSELVPLFPSKFFHIGSDETAELGQGKTKKLADEIGIGKVYFNHIQKVAEIMKPYNKRLMFWGDIAMRYPELLQTLPKDMIVMSWVYDPLSDFVSYLKPFRDAGLDVMVCPGASNWSRTSPNLDVALRNIQGFVRDGQKYGALGMFNTTWDDDGEALFNMTWFPVVFGASAAWQPGESGIDEFKARFDWAFYRNTDGALARAMESLSRAHTLLSSKNVGDASDGLFWLDPFSERGAKLTQQMSPVLRDLRLAAEEALETFYTKARTVKKNGDTIPYYVFAAKRTDYLGMKFQFAEEMSKAYWDAYQNLGDRRRVTRTLRNFITINGPAYDLRDHLGDLKTEYRDLWLAENRPYWLESVLVKYDSLQQKFSDRALSVIQWLNYFNEKGALPPPETLGFFLKN